MPGAPRRRSASSTWKRWSLQRPGRLAPVGSAPRAWRRRTVLGVAVGAGAQALAGRAGAQAPPGLRLALPEAPSTLDPQRAFAPVDRAIVRQLFEPLFRFGTGPEPEPGAAAEAQSNDDASQWTFTLRPDVRWPGGELLSAAGFVRGWERLLSPAVPDDLFTAFRPVRAAGLFRAGLTDLTTLGLQAAGPLELAVELDGPGAHF